MKNIVITGSTRGIGLELARVFLNNNCNVTISGRSADIPDSTKKSLIQYSDKIIYIPCNVQDEEQIENLWKQSKEKWGSVDCWINNAGQNTPYKSIWETDTASADAVIDTNIKGMVYGSKIAAKNMLRQDYGQIWNMEGLGSDGMIQSKTILYGMTKRALTYFTKGLSKELKDTGVLAGSISPGMMLTDFITKTPDGETSKVISDPEFKKVFNTLADRPETVAAYVVPKILKNKKQGAHIVWLSKAKAARRFMSKPFRNRRLI